MERGERVEMNPEIGKANDNLDKVKKPDTKNQKIDIDSPVKVGKDIKAKQADTADAGKNLRDKISDFVCDKFLDNFYEYGRYYEISSDDSG